MNTKKPLTKSGIKLDIKSEKLDYHAGIDFIVEKLDQNCGMYLSSGIDYPGRYSRWELGFLNPPLEFIAIENTVYINSLNPRGDEILKIFTPILAKHSDLLLWNGPTLCTFTVELRGAGK